MRFFVAVCLIALTVAIPAWPQSAHIEADRGNIVGGVYTNRTLGLSWQLPDGWNADYNGSSALGTGYAAALRLLPGGEANQVVEIDYAKNANSDVRSDLERQGWKASDRTGYYSLGGLLPAHRFDFSSQDAPDRFLAVVAGQRRVGFILVFMADSSACVDELVNSALTMKVRPDWGETEDPLPLTQPGSAPRRVRVSQGVSQALLLQQVKPYYPAEALRARIQGTVVMVAHISKEGTVKNLIVLSGPEELVQAALDAVSQWRYKPYYLNGSPIEVETQITVAFTL